MMNRQGASLVELIMVLAVMGIIAAMAGESLVAMVLRYQERAVTAKLAAELRAARVLAVEKREKVRVVFEPGTSEIQTRLGSAAGRLLRQYNFRKSGVVVERLSRGSTITFYPSGRSASPTTITLRNGRQERSQLTVSIIGRVSIKR
ncbi:MAG: prepilin-type N-terminal cleavage/methylation domain-containing protein [Nitrospira sp.]|nr:prepilin-type N-terminal cleavage/methylation domain-containing protein [Nitrospira sp.]